MSSILGTALWLHKCRESVIDSRSVHGRCCGTLRYRSVAKFTAILVFPSSIGSDSWSNDLPNHMASSSPRSSLSCEKMYLSILAALVHEMGMISIKTVTSAVLFSQTPRGTPKMAFASGPRGCSKAVFVVRKGLSFEKPTLSTLPMFICSSNRRARL